LVHSVHRGVYLGSLQYLGHDSVWLELDVEVPFSDFFGVGDHRVELLDALDSLWRPLEQALPNVGHHALVLPDLRRYAYECAQLGRQVDVLAPLSDLKQRLSWGVYFHFVGGLEVVNHIGPRLLIPVVEDVILRVHGPLDLMHLIGTVGPILGHDDGALVFFIDKIVIKSLEPIVN